MTGGWITVADRVRWQQKAVAELDVILAAHPDLPVLAWTIAASGAALSARVVVPAGQREVFAGWRLALGLGQAAETRSAHGSAGWLHARGVRGGVTVSLAATVFASDEEGR